MTKYRVKSEYVDRWTNGAVDLGAAKTVCAGCRWAGTSICDDCCGREDCARGASGELIVDWAEIVRLAHEWSDGEFGAKLEEILEQVEEVER